MIVGLTGGICCGKSTVSKTFINNNIRVVDADLVARQVVEPGTVGLTAIVNCFGVNYLLPDGTLNRSKLGDNVFKYTSSMFVLNEIMGPLIQEEATKQFNKLKDEGHKIIIWDAALVIESNNANKYRPLIVVSCTPEQQLERLMKRGTGHGPLTKEQAMARINAQMPSEQKVKMADYVIDTSGTIESSVKQTEELIKQLREF